MKEYLTALLELSAYSCKCRKEKKKVLIARKREMTTKRICMSQGNILACLKNFAKLASIAFVDTCEWEV